MHHPPCRYLAGKVTHSTRVRCEPFLEGTSPMRYTVAAQSQLPFGALAELCNAVGPPFIG